LAAQARICEAISAFIADVRLASGSVAVASSRTAFISLISSGGNTAPVLPMVWPSLSDYRQFAPPATGRLPGSLLTIPFRAHSIPWIARRRLARTFPPERLALAEASGAMTLDLAKEDIHDWIRR
jgi:hypothetical protein